MKEVCSDGPPFDQKVWLCSDELPFDQKVWLSAWVPIMTVADKPHTGGQDLSFKASRSPVQSYIDFLPNQRGPSHAISSLVNTGPGTVSLS